MLRRSLSSVALVACLAVVGAACGDDSSSDSAEAGETTASSHDPGHMGESENPTPTVEDSAIDGVAQFSGVSRDHVEGAVDYDQTPPVGGAHADIWQSCGFYSDPIITEQGVHSMEHGAVWITYRSDLAADQLADLEELADNEYVLVSQWPGSDLPSPIVASAWELQLKVDSTDDARLSEFVDTYANGPQTPEPGAPCDGGDDQSALPG